MADRRRHIQNQNGTASRIPHFGYPSRLVPCTLDPGSCAYLDAAYRMQDLSMLYTFVMWAMIGGLLLIMLALRVVNPRKTAKSMQRGDLESGDTGKPSPFSRAWGAVSAVVRHNLLPEASLIRCFGHVTRLQVAILCGILSYLFIFTLVGVVYKSWATPVEQSTSPTIRTPLGPMANRVGAFAYALTPLTVALSTRENVLSLITGIPYQHFNFLHRWIGRIIFIQSVLHVLAWTIVHARLYQPQPNVYATFITEKYVVFGIFAQTLITFIYIFSIKRVTRWTGHEFFRKSHYIAGILYLGACWGHWHRLACWMISSIGIIFLDRGCRLFRTLAIHWNVKDDKKGIGFKAAEGKITSFDDGDDGIVARLEFSHDDPPWRAGQYFFLCFPDMTVWQSHPFTPVPNRLQSHTHHAYIIRCLKGETSRLPLLANITAGTATTPVILTGPYGNPILDKTAPNILAIAGGTGISFALPLAAAAAAAASPTNGEVPAHRVELVWVIRRARNIEWVQDEINALLNFYSRNVIVRIFISRESPTLELSAVGDMKGSALDNEKQVASRTKIGSSFSWPQHPNFRISWLSDHHPNMRDIVQEFIGTEPASPLQSSVATGRTQVVASGPAGMGRDLRAAVAAKNNPRQVWKGREDCDVDLYWDNRYS